ncbi:MAG TPA: CoA transferase [Acetobacteraceae bacterium]|nr:CoA transferase [Acetobacteraceae bacterium]
MGILQGVRVLELGQVLAAPFAGSIFSDLGAEVLKIERVEGGDDARRMGRAFRHDDSLTFAIFNRGKRSIALDLKSADGLAAFEKLAATADILIHNLRPGVAESFGIGGAELCARHPQLIFCELSAFGHVGPFARRPGYEPLIQAFSGLSSINGGPDDPPMRLGVAACDQGAGMWTVIGALAMLQRRGVTGRGGVVNASLLETALAWSAQKSEAWVNEGNMPPRHASGHPDLVPYEAFDAADGPFLICCGNDRLFARLAREMQRPDWVADPRYVTNRKRMDNKSSLVAEMTAILRARPRAAWIAQFEAAGVPCAPINSLPEALAEPHVRALGMRQEVPGEDYSLTALPLSFDGVRPTIAHGAPRLAEANEEFLPARAPASVPGE